MSSSETRVLTAVRRIVRALRVSSRAAERELGLSGAQLFVLQKLAGARRPLSIGELARKTLTHQSSVSVVVARLVKRGLARSRPSPSDARKLEVALTAKGRALLRRAPGAAQERVIAAVSRLEPGRRARLASLLEQVIEHAGLGEGPAPMFFEE